jgi:hypothetical protein
VVGYSNHPELLRPLAEVLRRVDLAGDEQMRDANRDYKENGIPQTKMRALALESEFSSWRKDEKNWIGS